MRTTIRRSISKRCPYRDEVDTGVLTIVFPGEAPELHALAERIDRFLVAPISHEELTRRIREAVDAEVCTSWQTGPWAVEVVS